MNKHTGNIQRSKKNKQESYTIKLQLQHYTTFIFGTKLYNFNLFCKNNQHCAVLGWSLASSSLSEY